MISGNLTLIPQNSITKTTVWHKKFSHISHNFVNKMRHVPIFHTLHTDPVFLVCLFSSFTYDFRNSHSISHKIASQRLQLGTKSFLTSLTVLSIKCDLCRLFTLCTQTQSFLVCLFHHLPVISGTLTPIPQNSMTKTTVWHKKFSHISHNFVNKM